jgi:hypothetical protein
MSSRPKDISSLRNTKGVVRQILTIVKKIKVSSRVDLAPVAEKAEIHITKALATKLTSLGKALESSNAVKVAKYTQELTAILEDKYAKLEARIEKMRRDGADLLPKPTALKRKPKSPKSPKSAYASPLGRF